jgi:ribulose-phosphate 3-epimerase
MLEIIPAILTSDIREVEEKLGLAQGVSKRVQIDIVDGQFVNNRTIDPSLLGGVETDVNLDFHLMTKEPFDWVERAVRGGADRIIGQIEMMSDQIGFIGKVQEVGLSVGLAIDIETPVTKLDPVILTDVDVILVMSYPAGFGGQPFDKRVIGKIKELSKLRAKGNSSFKICVDGGIGEDTISEVRKAGADEVAVSKSLFNGDLTANIEKLTKAAYK